MSFFKKFSVFILIFSFNNLTLSLANRRFPNLFKENFGYIADLLSSIGFPVELRINIYFYSFLISVVTYLFLDLFLKPNFSDNEIFEKIKNYFVVLVTYASIYLFILFIFRFVSFPRLNILINLLLFPIFYIFIKTILNFSILKNPIFFWGLFVSSLIILIFTFSSNESTENAVTTTIDNEETPNFVYDYEKIAENDSLNCLTWQGSNITTNCSSSVTNLIDVFDFRFHNIVKYKEKIFLLTRGGIVYEYINNEIIQIFDFSESVYTRDDSYTEAGLLSLAFHPTENYFLISYTNNEVSVVVEKIFYQDQVTNISNRTILTKIPVNIDGHFSASLYWSDFFEGFLISYGDMEASGWGPLNSEPLNTSNPRGKVLLIESNNKYKFNSPLISLVQNQFKLDNIVAYGFRNPWQILEYKNQLFITDVGYSTTEELNIVNLNSNLENNIYNSTLHGWPLFEGNDFLRDQTFKNSDQLIPDISKNNIDLYYWDDGVANSAFEYLVNNSVEPTLFYHHSGDDPLSYRAAIIGGDILQSERYGTRYIFTDYISKEIFLYDFENNQLDIFMMQDIFYGNPVSIKTLSDTENVLIVLTTLGEIIEVKLP